MLNEHDNKQSRNTAYNKAENSRYGLATVFTHYKEIPKKDLTRFYQKILDLRTNHTRKKFHHPNSEGVLYIEEPIVNVSISFQHKFLILNKHSVHLSNAQHRL